MTEEPNKTRVIGEFDDSYRSSLYGTIFVRPDLIFRTSFEKENRVSFDNCEFDFEIIKLFKDWNCSYTF